MKDHDIEQVRVDINLPDIDKNAGRFLEDNGDTEILYVGSTSWSIVTSDAKLIDYLNQRTSTLSSAGGPEPLALRLRGNQEMLEDIIHDELRNAKERDRADEAFVDMVEDVQHAETTQESMTLDSTTGQMKPQTVGKKADGLVLSVSTEHQVHIIEVDGEDLVIKERWHDGSHACERRMNVRKLTHLLCNITDEEIASITSR